MLNSRCPRSSCTSLRLRLHEPALRSRTTIKRPASTVTHFTEEADFATVEKARPSSPKSRLSKNSNGLPSVSRSHEVIGAVRTLSALRADPAGPLHGHKIAVVGHTHDVAAHGVRRCPPYDNLTDFEVFHGSLLLRWPWWRELQPGKPQRVEQPRPIAQVAEDPPGRRRGELDQGGCDHDVVGQAALRLPHDVDDLELTTIGEELAAHGLEVGDRAYGCRLLIRHVQAYHEGLASVGSLPHRQSLVGALRPFLRPARDAASPPRRARTSRCRPASFRWRRAMLWSNNRISAARLSRRRSSPSVCARISAAKLSSSRRFRASSSSTSRCVAASTRSLSQRAVPINASPPTVYTSARSTPRSSRISSRTWCECPVPRDLMIVNERLRSPRPARYERWIQASATVETWSGVPSIASSLPW